MLEFLKLLVEMRLKICIITLKFCGSLARPIGSHLMSSPAPRDDVHEISTLSPDLTYDNKGFNVKDGTLGAKDTIVEQRVK